MDFLSHLHTFRLTSGLGEPTIHRHFSDILHYLSSTYPHLRINFFTNGIALNRQGILETLVGNVVWINVSLNAATRETWNEVCGADKFDRVCSNLRKLQRAKQALGHIHPLVFASMVITRANILDLPRMPALCRKLGIDRLTIIPFFALNFNHPDKYGYDYAFEKCREDYDRFYPETLKGGQEHGVSLELPLPSHKKSVAFGLDVRPFYDFAGIGEEDPLSIAYLIHNLFDSRQDKQRCQWLWRTALIGKTDRSHIGAPKVTHYLYPCLGPLVSVDFSTRTAYNFPKIKGFLKVWNNPELTFLRSAQQFPGTCSVCDFCKHSDTRDPANFEILNHLLEEWQPSSPPAKPWVEPQAD
jgi:hypothetical protein